MVGRLQAALIALAGLLPLLAACEPAAAPEPEARADGKTAGSPSVQTQTAPPDPGEAAPPAAAKRTASCPAEGVALAPGDVCIARSGANWYYAFVYPAIARRGALEAELRKRERGARAELQQLAEYALLHPNGQFHHAEIYRVDAATLPLIALSYQVSEYVGGAHGWFIDGTLIWDRRRDRKLSFSQLFADPRAAQAELSRMACPALAALRAAMDREDRNPRPKDCPDVPYEPRLLAGLKGTVEQLRISWQELEGYAGGTYEVTVPVTPALLAGMRSPYRRAFRPSRHPVTACNPNYARGADGCIQL